MSKNAYINTIKKSRRAALVRSLGLGLGVTLAALAIYAAGYNHGRADGIINATREAAECITDGGSGFYNTEARVVCIYE